MSVERRLLVEALPGYEIADEIGRGGWGIVLEAAHRTLERQVAVKQLPRAFGADPDVRARFLAEARVVASLDHPHIVPLYDFVERDGMCLLVMEYMPDGTLWDRFQDGGLSPEASCAVALAVLSALAHAHSKGVLHRDVKPENVLFNAAGVPKLADFGIAKVLGDSASTRTATGVIMGTPAYMAPEQGLGHEVSPATDVYAVGVMLYELLSGNLPFESTGEPLAQLFRHVHEPAVPLSEVAPSVPTPVVDAVMAALEKEPGDRPADAAAFARSLDAAASAGFGRDWLTRSEVPVLAARMLLGDPAEAPAATGRSSETIIVERPDPPPPSLPPPPPASAGAAPTPAAPAASPASAPAPPAPSPAPPTAPPPSPQTTPPPVFPQPSSGPSLEPTTSGPSQLSWLLGAVAVLVLAVGAFIVLSNGGGDDQPPESIPAAAVGRLDGACRQSGTADEICDCAVARAQIELSVAAFMANDALLQEDGDSLTAPMQAILTRCEEESIP